MAFFDKLGQAAQKAAQGAGNLAKSAAEGAGDMVGIQKLKIKINEQEKKINECKQVMGELTWQQYNEGLDHAADIEQQCLLIREALAEIDDLEAQIAAIKAEKEGRAQAQPAYAEPPAQPAAPAPPVYAEPVPEAAPAAGGSKFCTGCGAQLAADARFCGVCGAKQ